VAGLAKEEPPADQRPKDKVPLTPTPSPSPKRTQDRPVTERPRAETSEAAAAVPRPVAHGESTGSTQSRELTYSVSGFNLAPEVVEAAPQDQVCTVCGLFARTETYTFC